MVEAMSTKPEQVAVVHVSKRKRVVEQIAPRLYDVRPRRVIVPAETDEPKQPEK